MDELNKTILKSQLMRHEGLRLRLYSDTVGKLTIGYGRNIQDVGITPMEAVFMLDNDIDNCIEDVENFLPWVKQLDAVRFSVLVNMCFMGIGGLLSFHNMLNYLHNGKYNEAAEHLLDSKYARQVGNRATELAEQLKTGQWQEVR